jgi:DNA-binding response OmpR family regulator
MSHGMIPKLTGRTARGGDEAKVEGLLAGADDYVAKPFNARELIARGELVDRRWKFLG